MRSCWKHEADTMVTEEVGGGWEDREVRGRMRWDEGMACSRACRVSTWPWFHLFPPAIERAFPAIVVIDSSSPGSTDRGKVPGAYEISY